jgi:adenylate cyclase
MKGKGLSLGVTRIGVHCGPAIVGNFGGQRFFNYTAIGDTVNTAARLESANKHLSTRICISGSVAQTAGDALLRPSSILYVKGKNDGVATFEALYPSPQNRQLAEDWLVAWTVMETRPGEAVSALRKFQEAWPGDPLAQMHLARASRGETGTSIRLTEK